jgi:AcrR family transcriptional regulator
VTQITEKPLRADARRNRDKIMKAARAVFAEQGRDAQMDDVARKADVGVGTVYRHFPTKDALLLALSEELFAAMAAQARTALELEDPWEAFLQAMWFGAEQAAGDRAFSEILAARPMVPSPAKVDLQATVDELMRRAKEAGKMRPDVMIDDIGLLMCGIGSATHIPHPVDEAWRRHLGIILDGMHAEAASGPLHR